jgi:hypothetical protein
MLRSRWLALRAAAVLVAAAAVPSVQAQRCPFMANFQLQLQTRYMPPPMMLMPQQPMMPQFGMPMMTPPRMPVAFRPPVQPYFPHLNTGMPHYPNFETGFGMRVPTINTGLQRQTLTRLETEMRHQVQLERFPTLRWDEFAMHHRYPSFVFPRDGVGLYGRHNPPQVTWNLTTVLKRVATLEISTLRRETTLAKERMTTENRLRLELTAENRVVRIPSLSFGPRMPPTAPGRPQIGGPDAVAARRPGIVGPNPAAPNPSKTPPVAAKPGTPVPQTSITGRFSMVCGSCHGCKGTPQVNPRQLQMDLQYAQYIPALTSKNGVPLLGGVESHFRPPPDKFVSPSHVSPSHTGAGAVGFRTADVPHPFAPPTLQSGTLPQPAPAPTLVTTGLWLLTSPPIMAPPPGKGLLIPPPDSLSTLTKLVSAPPPESKLETTILPAIGDPNPPLVQRAGAEPLQLPPLIELAGLTETVRPTAPRPQGPSLVQVLMQPPPLPSGAQVTPREMVLPTLDEPPVVPSLVESLIKPPPLPPLPGA